MIAGQFTETCPLVVSGLEAPPTRCFLPDPAGIVEIALVAQRIVVQAEILYRYGLLRIFLGGWWDFDVRRKHEGERGDRP